MNQAPNSFDQFYASLATHNVSAVFDENLAQILRMQASTKDYGALITSGKGALAYVPWLVDGMNMSNKLIVHLNSQEAAFNPIIQELMENDIRITSHHQDQHSFTLDIAEHRMDLLLLTEDAMTEIENWLALLSDAGLLVLLASENEREALAKKYSEDYFCLNKAQLFISRKGTQHRKIRKRSRQRRASKTT